MAWRTNLMSTRHTTKFRDLKIQEFKRLERDWRRVSQEMLRATDSDRGMPRYLDGRELLGMPKSRELCHWIARGVLKNKT
jgi:hypothetical protein